MSLHTRTRAIVVGAGIGGLATAVALRRVGVEVEVFERASELRPAGFGISVVSNAVAALRVLGIDLGLEARGQTIAHTEIMTGQGGPCGRCRSSPRATGSAHRAWPCTGATSTRPCWRAWAR
ncbi:NAD-binding protein [Streptomyces netropsis]